MIGDTLLNPMKPYVLALFCILCGFTSAKGDHPKQGPSADAGVLNVVFILADDLGWGDIGCFGQFQFETPNLDRLAASGIRFTQHYSGAPVCAPSRCVLLTGRHLGHAEIRGNKQASTIDPSFEEGQIPLSEKVITFAKVLQQQGYRTGAFGKWGLGPVGSSGSPDRQGFDEFFGYNCQAVAHSYYPASLWKNSTRIPLNANPIPGHAKQLSGDIRPEEWVGENYAPYLIIDEAIEFLRKSASQPFFLYLPFIEPHVALHPPLNRLDDFPRDWDSYVYRGENGYVPTTRPRAAYAALVTDIDRYVGRILDTLEELNLRDRTLVIFTSDNGAAHAGTANSRLNVGGTDITFFQSTRHLRGFKGSVYEGGIRVPMIASLPGRIPTSVVSDQPTYFADWFPTILEATGISYSDYDVDGESFWHLLIGDKPSWKRENPMVWVFPEYGGQVAIRSEQWKLVRQRLNSPRGPDQWELYDLSKDESEMENVAWKYPDLVQLLSERLRNELEPNALFPIALSVE